MVQGSKFVVGILVLAMSSLLIIVEGADKSVINGPYCIKKSLDTDYNKNAARLMSILAGETKNKFRNTHHDDYRYYHSYPNTDSGSVFGGGFCDRHLTKWGCENCLRDARHKIKSRCDHTFESSVQLVDCSLWFRKIVR
ncbi:hypothetical protein LINPERPRIM_LOCUS14204 [Linum perenne]